MGSSPRIAEEDACAEAFRQDSVVAPPRRVVLRARLTSVRFASTIAVVVNNARIIFRFIMTMAAAGAKVLVAARALAVAKVLVVSTPRKIQRAGS